MTPLIPAAPRGGGSNEISYWLWDSNQQPAYQKCADAFHTANPESHREDRAVRLERLLDEADHRLRVRNRAGRVHRPPAKYPEFASRDNCVALDDLIKQDNVDLTQYARALADVWKGNDGKQYGLPKDLDTIGMFYNKEMAAAAGVTQEQLDTMEWNPTDGGTYEQTIAKLTVDANGVHGDQPGFDKTNVKTYGLGLAGSGGALRPDPVEHLHRQQRMDRNGELGRPSTTSTIPNSRRPSPGGGR